MTDEQLKQAALDIIVEAYKLGRNLEGGRHAQRTLEHYDGLCECVAQETERLHGELLALVQSPALGELLLVPQPAGMAVQG